MEDRVPPAGHGQMVTGDDRRIANRLTGFGVPFHDRRADHRAAALDRRHHMPAQDRHPGRGDLGGERAGIGRARVDHRVDLDTGGEMVRAVR